MLWFAAIPPGPRPLAPRFHLRILTEINAQRRLLWPDVSSDIWNRRLNSHANSSNRNDACHPRRDGGAWSLLCRLPPLPPKTSAPRRALVWGAIWRTCGASSAMWWSRRARGTPRATCRPSRRLQTARISRWSGSRGSWSIRIRRCPISTCRVRR